MPKRHIRPNNLMLLKQQPRSPAYKKSKAPSLVEKEKNISTDSNIILQQALSFCSKEQDLNAIRNFDDGN